MARAEKAMSQDVRTAIVGGRVMMGDGRTTTLAVRQALSQDSPSGAARVSP